MSLEHYRAIAARVTPVPDRPSGARVPDPAWAYIMWLEEHLDYLYGQYDQLFADIYRLQRASEANFQRWQAAQQKLAKIELILNPPPEGGVAVTDTGTSG